MLMQTVYDDADDDDYVEIQTNDQRQHNESDNNRRFVSVSSVLPEYPVKEETDRPLADFNYALSPPGNSLSLGLESKMKFIT